MEGKDGQGRKRGGRDGKGWRRERGTEGEMGKGPYQVFQESPTKVCTASGMCACPSICLSVY